MRNQLLQRFLQAAAPPGIRNHFQGLNERDPSGNGGAELMVELSPASQLTGRNDERHIASSAPADQPVTARSSMVFKSRLLFRPTICSETWPPLKMRSVGMARMPYWAARFC